MSKIFFPRYQFSGLLELAERLNEDYYTSVDNLCRNAYNILSRLEQKEEHTSTILYISMSKKFLEQLREFTILRKEIMVPYIGELNKKALEKHDCNTCSGKCTMQHTTQVAGLKESHQKIKEILYRLQMVALPLYSDIQYPAEYKKLRNEIMIIDTSLTELFYLEEACLIPKMIEAQRSIHAYS